VTWCELHCHSYHSLLDGVSSPEALARTAAARGYPALALTDHDSLAGIVDHATACAEAGIRPIAGVELTFADDTHPRHPPSRVPVQPASGGPDPGPRAYVAPRGRRLRSRQRIERIGRPRLHDL